MGVTVLAGVLNFDVNMHQLAHICLLFRGSDACQQAACDELLRVLTLLVVVTGPRVHRLSFAGNDLHRQRFLIANRRSVLFLGGYRCATLPALSVADISNMIRDYPSLRVCCKTRPSTLITALTQCGTR